MTKTSVSSLSPCLLACFAILSTLVVTAPAHGEPILNLDLNVEFSMGTEPMGGPPPWLRATFDDEDTPGSVILTMSDLSLIGGEHVKNWAFSLYTDFDPTLLVFSAPTVVSGNFKEDQIVITTGVDFFQADGDGFHDIKFLFPDTNGPNTKFGPGDAVSFVITSTQPGPATFLATHHFQFPNIEGGGQGVFVTSAQIQGIGDLDESGWIGFVPEPSSAVLLILGVIALLPIARRRIKR